MASLSLYESEAIRRVSDSTVWSGADTVMVLHKMDHDPFCVYVLSFPLTLRSVNAVTVAAVTTIFTLSTYLGE